MSGDSGTLPAAAQKTVLAIDPGRAKCGIAIVSGRPARILHRVIVPTQDLVTTLGPLLRTYGPVDMLVIGDGTGSRVLVSAIRSTFTGQPLELVDEYGTSQAARLRYCDENPPRGWKRLLPAGLRVPDEPYDDYVALILAERWLDRPAIS